MNRDIAILPGSFDPLTTGHVDLINRGLKLFNTIIIGIGVNSEKNYMFDIKTRKRIVESMFNSNTKIIVKSYKGLTVDFCKQEDCKYILRGLRSTIDFEYEKSIASTNQEIDDSIETIFLIPKKEHRFISSTIVKDIIKNNGELTKFVPDLVIQEIKKKMFY